MCTACLLSHTLWGTAMSSGDADVSMTKAETAELLKKLQVLAASPKHVGLKLNALAADVKRARARGAAVRERVAATRARLAELEVQEAVCARAQAKAPAVTRAGDCTAWHAVPANHANLQAIEAKLAALKASASSTEARLGQASSTAASAEAQIKQLVANTAQRTRAIQRKQAQVQREAGRAAIRTQRGYDPLQRVPGAATLGKRRTQPTGQSKPAPAPPASRTR